jgi:hypothetical protein
MRAKICLLVIAIGLGMAGCERSVVDPADALLGRLELSAGGALVAAWRHDTGWSGGPITVSLGEHGEGRTLTVWVVTRGGVERVLGTDYTVTYVLDPGAPDGVLNLHPALPLWEGTVVRLFPAASGVTQIRFLLRRQGELEGVTTAVQVQVVP